MKIRMIPLTALVPSPANVRKTGAMNGIEELAASIEAHGLLQNLQVREAANGKFEVVAGGRRLAALKLLAKRKALSKDAPVGCNVLSGEDASEISLAENEMREAMHPADQFEAFKALTDAGHGPEDIAARFGVTPTVVRQRLKLGAVSPKLMTLFRQGEMSLDTLTAFTITDDHDRQERVWDGLPSFQRSRERILQALSEGQIPSDDRRAQFVGTEAYEAAGGTIIRDLFDEEGGGFFADAPLLDRLASEKLQAAGEKVRGEGGRWVSVAVDFDHAAASSMRRVFPKAVPLSGKERKQLNKLQLRYDALCEKHP